MSVARVQAFFDEREMWQDFDYINVTSETVPYLRIIAHKNEMSYSAEIHPDYENLERIYDQLIYAMERYENE